MIFKETASKPLQADPAVRQWNRVAASGRFRHSGTDPESLKCPPGFADLKSGTGLYVTVIRTSSSSPLLPYAKGDES